LVGAVSNKPDVNAMFGHFHKALRAARRSSMRKTLRSQKGGILRADQQRRPPELAGIAGAAAALPIVEPDFEAMYRCRKALIEVVT
jgi:hypothetical protein